MHEAHSDSSHYSRASGGVQPPSGLWPAPFAETPVRASVSVPGSKSLTNRALVLAALSEGPSVLHAPLVSRDTALMAQALSALGARVDRSEGNRWRVTPGWSEGTAEVDCGLAGTVMRFVPPLAGLRVGSTRFDGDPHARTRPMGQILRALRVLGVEVEETAERLPFEVTGTGSVAGGQVVIDASASSQFVSALLLAAPRFEQGVDVLHDGKPVPSLPHIDMTVACLREHRVEVDDSEPNRWRVLAGPVQAEDADIEPDLSNAGPFLMLALATGGEVSVNGWPRQTTQAGDTLRDLLAQMGARVEWSTGVLTVAAGDVLEGLDADLHDVGELTPALAALCALAETPSHLRSIGHIRGHETDRLAALTRELRDLGADVTEHPDGLTIRPARLHGGVFHTYADHRMAHAGALLGAAVRGVEVENIATTAKTMPGFVDLWAEMF